MKNISVLDTLNLSIPERIQLVEDIWDSIAADADSIALSEKEILDERIKAFHSDPQAGSPWDEVYERITKRREI
ncbi:addiction module protein [candidate division KSB1 bacterium]|nr:addiction module protein [candidate division KSB1 bacterium]